MSKLLIVSVLPLIMLAAPAIAQQAPKGTAPTATPVGKYERIICKTMQETGSLIKRHKTCKSQAAWDKEADAMRTNGVSDSCRARGDGGIC